MFESVTGESILAEMLDEADSSYDKREGSVLHTVFAPVAFKIAETYNTVNSFAEKIFTEMFADTASLNTLIKMAADRGIEYYEAETAVISVNIVFNTNSDISPGDTFFIDDVRYVYNSVKSDDGTEYLLECSEAGALGNVSSGNLIYEGTCANIASAQITGIVVYGRDAESADELRQRYYDSLKASAFGGNIADYKEKCLAVSGVGGVQVRRAWNGGGTVKLVLVSSNYTAIDEDSGVIQSVQNLFDPIVDGEHTGNGIATVEHIVTAVSAGETPVNIVSSIEFEDGVTLDSILNNVQEALQNYFISLCETWADTGKAVVRIGKIESILSSVSGIIDAYDTTINGSTSNITFDGDNIPVLGTVNGI